MLRQLLTDTCYLLPSGAITQYVRLDIFGRGSICRRHVIWKVSVYIYQVIRQPDCNTVIYSINTYQITIRHAVANKAVRSIKCSVKVKSINYYCSQKGIKHLMYTFCWLFQRLGSEGQVSIHKPILDDYSKSWQSTYRNKILSITHK